MWQAEPVDLNVNPGCIKLRFGLLIYFRYPKKIYQIPNLAWIPIICYIKRFKTDSDGEQPNSCLFVSVAGNL